MRKVTKILNVPFDNLTMKKAVDKVLTFLDSPGNRIVCTPNPEIVMLAQKDNELMNILLAADMVIADGIGIVIASRLQKNKLPHRVSGYDLTQNVFKIIKNTGHKVYFFGGAPGVCQDAKNKMEILYPGISIVGIQNGYFTPNDEKSIIENIRNAQTDILLVGLGSPKQEKWIYENLRFTGAKVAIGVGGSFDVMSGKVKRAPIIFQKMGLEWFYRLISQPTRFKRMLSLPLFMIIVILKKIGVNI